MTRYSDIEIDDDEVENLLKTIEEEVRRRRRGAAVRLQIEAGAPAEVEQFLMSKLDLDPTDVYRHPGLLDLAGLFQIHGLAGYPHLHDPQFVPQLVPDFVQATSLWASIRAATSSSTIPMSPSAMSSNSSRPRPTTSAFSPSN